MLGLPLGTYGCFDMPTTVGSPDDPQAGGDLGDDDDSWQGEGDDDVDDDGDDDAGWPYYEGDIQLDVSSLSYGCTVEVAYVSEDQDPPPSGTFDFDVELVGWASDCWIEMWDDTSVYCEGWDVDGEPCDPPGAGTRPGWYMLQDDYGYDTAAGHWDSWYLALDYEMVWPPLATASLFICENAGDPESGTGTFWSYMGCCDAVTDHCEIVQLGSW